MKVIFDEQLPPALARALNELFRGEHDIVHMRDKFGPGETDAEWISTLSQDGRWVVISADRRISRNKAEFQAFRKSRFIGFFMARKLYQSRVTKQAERILVLWDAIVDQVNRSENGGMFELPAQGARIKPL